MSRPRRSSGESADSLTIDQKEISVDLSASDSPSEKVYPPADPNNSLVGIAAYFPDNDHAPSSFDFLASTVDGRQSPPFGSVEICDVRSTESGLALASHSGRLDGGDDDSSESLSLDSFFHDRDESHAWIPKERTRSCLERVAAPPSGGEIALREDDELTTARIYEMDRIVDPVFELLRRVSGPEFAGQREIGDSDISKSGLKRRIAAEHFRAALEMTADLIRGHSEPETPPDSPLAWSGITRLSPTSLQLWTTRLTLMTSKLGLYSHVEAEMEAFGDLDRPDLYVQFYRGNLADSPSQRGSMVPFALRILWAELPIRLNRPEEALDRLYRLLPVVETMIANLRAGKSADGISASSSSEISENALRLWRRRRLTLLYSISSSLYLAKDPRNAVEILDRIVDEEEETGRKYAALSYAGKLLLQFGDVGRSRDYFVEAGNLFTADTPDDARATDAMNLGFASIGVGKFRDALEHFEEALKWAPFDPVASNNLALTYVYLGRMKEAKKTLRDAIDRDPSRNLHEGIVFNLATLFEFDASGAGKKKKELLELVSRHRGDGFDPQCFKIA